jgi:hypothetical protein
LPRERLKAELLREHPPAGTVGERVRRRGIHRPAQRHRDIAIRRAADGRLCIGVVVNDDIGTAKIDFIISVVGVLSTAGAAGFWLWSSLIDVLDNIDTFTKELQRIGQVNSCAAICACVAALCGTYSFARNLGWI